MVSFYGALALLACGSLDGQSLSYREKYKNVRIEKKEISIPHFSPVHVVEEGEKTINVNSLF